MPPCRKPQIPITGTETGKQTSFTLKASLRRKPQILIAETETFAGIFIDPQLPEVANPKSRSPGLKRLDPPPVQLEVPCRKPLAGTETDKIGDRDIE